MIVMSKKTVMLTTTERCNLNCTYCYEKNKTLKSMPYNTAIDIISKELTADDEYDEVEIQFFGGEPFFEAELIKDVCNFIWSKQWPKKYQCFTTTNGTLVHGEIKKWLLENKDRFICSLSLDGTKRAHDINRCNSFDMIDIDFFKSTWPEQTVKMTISPESLPYLAESVIYIHELGFSFHNNLAYGVDWSDERLLAVLEEQLKILADFYIDHPEIPQCSMLGMSIENVILGRRIERWCGAGVSMRSYDTFGNLYPCHMFQPISTELVQPDVKQKTTFEKLNTLDPKCIDCPIFNVCPTCYGHNYSATGEIAKRDEGLCKFTKANTLATSYIWLKKFERYNADELGVPVERACAILDGAKLIQEKLPAIM